MTSSEGTCTPDQLLQHALRVGTRDAVEITAVHAGKDAETTARDLAVAQRLGLAVTGWSDHRGPGDRRAAALGRVTLPAEHDDLLTERAQAHARSTRVP